MKPSISMLAWYMRQDEPVCSIKDDAPVISGVRFLADETVLLSPDYAYVGAAAAFFSDEKYAGGFIVVHGQDFLLFRGREFDSLLNKLLSGLDFFERWEQRLAAAAEKNAPLSDFIRIGEEVMEDFFVVCDMETNLLASSAVDPRDVEGTTWEYFFAHGHVSPTSLNAPLTDRSGAQIMEGGRFPRLVSRPNSNISDHITQLLYQDEEPIAYFTLNQTDRSPTRMQMQVIPVFCRYLICAREFASREPVIQSNARVLARLLSGERPEDKLLLGFRRRMPPGAFRVLFFRNSLREDSVHINVFLSCLRANGLLCTRMDRGAAALIADEGWEAAVEKILRSSSLSGMRCGVSAPTRDAASIPLRYRQAGFALERAVGKEGIFRCEDYAFSYMLYVLRNDESASILLHPAVEKLEEYDAETQNELLLTLREYLKHNKNHQKTLEALNIHRSTLKYRLQRIEEITGADLDDPDEEAYLRLSLWLRFPPENGR